MIAYGPVPSRRLGRSLGINNIPPKVCTYSCAYCQVGRTLKMETERRPYYGCERVIAETEEKVAQARKAGEAVDFLAFVPDGEPTLDADLGAAIRGLRRLGIPIAVITNGSLLWREDVREALRDADLVSVKVNAAVERTWRRVDRPHRSLAFDDVWEGTVTFARSYAGTLITETMLVSGMNDDPDSAREVGVLLQALRPATAYLSVPTRPPADRRVHAPAREAVEGISLHLAGLGLPVALLTDYEGDAFALTGDMVQDLLGITAVHPMTEEAVGEFLRRAGAEWQVVEGLLADGRLETAEYGGKRFYRRRTSEGSTRGSESRA